MPTLAPNGVEIYYERHGQSGDALVFVHGFTGDITDWRFQIEEFAPTHRVLILDNRGHGRSSAPAEEAQFLVERMADDVEAIAAHVGFDRYHLVGHSMGGTIAQEIALRRAEKLLTLTLEDTSSFFGKHPLQAPEGMPPLPQERQQQVMERLSRMTPETLRFCWCALTGWEGTEARAPGIRTPTLILYGEFDAPLIADGSQRLAALIPGAEIHRIVTAGHCPQEETPAEYNRLLREFIGRAR